MASSYLPPFLSNLLLSAFSTDWLHLTCIELPDEGSGILSIKFIDTPGFGDNLDNKQWYVITHSPLFFSLYFLRSTILTSATFTAFPKFPTTLTSSLMMFWQRSHVLSVTLDSLTTKSCSSLFHRCNFPWSSRTGR